jgi:hypothetical protein
MLSADISGIETVEKLLVGIVGRYIVLNLPFQAVQQYGEVRGVHFKHEADKCGFKGLRVPILSVKIGNELLLRKRETAAGHYFGVYLVEFPVTGYH